MKLLANLLLVSAVFYSAIEVVISQHTSRKLFVEVQALQGERDNLIEEWGRLQLEQSTWATDDRIVSLSRSELRMEEPDEQSLVLLIK